MKISGKAVDVSVIVPAYNAAATLAACLDALLTQQLQPNTHCEIIVVDDGSTDATGQIAEQRPVQLIRLPTNQGRSAARNAGARAASGTILLFTDADCQPTPLWIERMIAPLRCDGTIAGVKGAYRSSQPQLMARFTQLELEEKYDTLRKQPTISFIDTYSAAYRRDVFLENGGFDNALGYSLLEDQDFSFRLAGRGYKMVFAPDARVYHHHLTSPRRYYQRKYVIGKSKSLILRRHPERIADDSRTPLSLKTQFALAMMLSALLPLTPFWRPARLLTKAALATFAASSIPFTVKALRRDPPVAAAALPLLLLRAFGLAHGYIDGLIRLRRLE